MLSFSVSIIRKIAAYLDASDLLQLASTCKQYSKLIIDKCKQDVTEAFPSVVSRVTNYQLNWIYLSRCLCNLALMPTPDGMGYLYANIKGNDHYYIGMIRELNMKGHGIVCNSDVTIAGSFDPDIRGFVMACAQINRWAAHIENLQTAITDHTDSAQVETIEEMKRQVAYWNSEYAYQKVRIIGCRTEWTVLHGTYYINSCGNEMVHHLKYASGLKVEQVLDKSMTFQQ